MIQWIINLFRPKLALPPSALIPEEPKELDAFDDDIFGMVKFGSQPSKDWRPYRPTYEIQSYGDCVSFSRLNCAEAKAKIEGVSGENNEELNFSDLDLAVNSGTSQNGNSLDNVSETARKKGVVLEKFCPYTRDWNERNARVASIPSYAKRYLLGNHAWVRRDGANIEREYLKNALEKGPIQIGIGLGDTYQYADDVIKPPSRITVWHAIMCDYIDEDGKLHCFDHYNRSNIVLSADYPIPFAKTFKDFPEQWRGMGVDEVIFYKRMVGKFVFRTEVSKGAKGEMYEVLDDKMLKVNFNINNQKFFNAVHFVIKNEDLAKKLGIVVVPVSEEDFSRLSKVAFEAGGIVEDDTEQVGSKLIKYFKVD